MFAVDILSISSMCLISCACFAFAKFYHDNNIDIKVFLKTAIKAARQRFYRRRNKNELFVNYHLTRQCNYQCGFCFHTAKTSTCLSLDEAKKAIKLLSEYGLQKINFAGGEPFMVKRGKFLGELLKYCKQELHIDRCSVVSNGSMVTERWFKKYGQYLDLFAVSIDSFSDDVNHKIGRFNASKKSHTQIATTCSRLCHSFGVAFKVNTVVNTYNWDEDMADAITKLNPIRWKIFQCLLIEGENYTGTEDNAVAALRDATKFLISAEQFASFVERHQHVRCLVPENNETMRNSYLILDEQMRFLNCGNGKKEPTKSILEIGVQKALSQIVFEKDMFEKRDGDYEIPTQQQTQAQAHAEARARAGLSENKCDFNANRPELQW